MWQARWVKAALERHFPGQRVQLVPIKTRGDKILDVPLARVGGKGLFVKEIEQALLEDRIDIAVHSMKDMPADIPAGLCIGAVPPREAPQDVLISKKGHLFAQLPPGSIIGTSSLRRGAQLRHARPELVVRPLRGNLDTRLKKLAAEELDAVVLAAAGVKRLALEEHITEYLPVDIMLPAVGQGALCIEIREHDRHIGSRIRSLDHPATRTAVRAERAFLKHLGGGCQVPIAGYGTVEDGALVLRGLVAAIDGSEIIRARLTGAPSAPESLGVKLAENLLARGAHRILDTLQHGEG